MYGVFRAYTQTEDLRGQQTIGYYTGNSEDIKIFLKNKALYYVELEPIYIRSITSDMVKQQEEKEKEKQQLLKRLKELEV